MFNETLSNAAGSSPAERGGSGISRRNADFAGMWTIENESESGLSTCLNISSVCFSCSSEKSKDSSSTENVGSKLHQDFGITL